MYKTPSYVNQMINGAIARSIRERCVVLAVDNRPNQPEVVFSDHATQHKAVEALYDSPYRAYVIAAEGSLKSCAFPTEQEA